MTKVGFVSLGCPKNLVDSEVMMGILARGGYELTPRADEAEVLVVNTCSFIEAAQKESVDAILEMAEHKKFGAAKKLIVAGCLVERYRAQILEQVHSFINCAVVVILITGVLLFIAEPRKLFDSAAFGPKMIILALAIVFQYTLYPRVRSMEAHIPIWGRLMALVSLGLWFGVAVCGRAIGFV